MRENFVKVEVPTVIYEDIREALKHMGEHALSKFDVFFMYNVFVTEKMGSFNNISFDKKNMDMLNSIVKRLTSKYRNEVIAISFRSAIEAGHNHYTETLEIPKHTLRQIVDCLADYINFIQAVFYAYGPLIDYCDNDYEKWKEWYERIEFTHLDPHPKVALKVDPLYEGYAFGNLVKWGKVHLINSTIFLEIINKELG